ncbi:MAG TPA: ThuA domain-containing protein [Bryobacteraceae bacterium]|nr:ThuA domain-containing protein [Bryobacteraceae bacterium]
MSRLVTFLVFALAWLPSIVQGQQKRVLYVTHSAGYRHDSVLVSQQVLQLISIRSGKLEITATEDLSALSDLANYSAVFFFTSGELALSDTQKNNLLDFIRNGGGFGGAHSATDTLYTWPEYGDLIGARFDGHPWVQEVKIDIEDPDHPATRNLVPSFSIMDEIYQFRDFNRTNVRVLMTLDTTSVDPRANGVNRTDNDFALAWTRLYGSGRVFYTALGHFDETWRDPRFQQMIEQALLWITGQTEGEGSPRTPGTPAITAGGVGNAATLQPPDTISPGSFVSIHGTNLTSGATMAGDVRNAAHRLAGTRVLLNNQPAQIIYASPQQINFLAPLSLEARPPTPPIQRSPYVELTVEIPGIQPLVFNSSFADWTPGVFTQTIDGRYATLWCTGLGDVRRNGQFYETVAKPQVLINDQPATVLFSGLASGWPGLYQINIELPPGATVPFQIRVTMQ